VGRATSVSVRDSWSRDLLADLGVDPGEVRVAADPAFALTPPTAAESATARDRLGAGTGPIVMVAVRPWRQGTLDETTWAPAIAAALDRLLVAIDGCAVFAPFHASPR